MMSPPRGELPKFRFTEGCCLNLVPENPKWRQETILKFLQPSFTSESIEYKAHMKWSLDNLSWLYQQSPVPWAIRSISVITWFAGLTRYWSSERQTAGEREKDRNPRTSLLSRSKKKNCSGLCYKVGPRLQECFRQVEAEVVRTAGAKFTKPGVHFSAHPL